MPEMLLTVDQAAQRLQLHPVTVRRQIERGQIRAIRKGRAVRVPESALAENAPTRNAHGASPDVQTQVDAIMGEFASGDLERRRQGTTLLWEASETVRTATFAAINEKLKDIPDTADFSAWSVCDRDGIDILEAEERELREKRERERSE